MQILPDVRNNPALRRILTLMATMAVLLGGSAGQALAAVGKDIGWCVEKGYGPGEHVQCTEPTPEDCTAFPDYLGCAGDPEPANEPPIAVDDVATAFLGTPVPIPVSANDSDPDDGLDLGSVTVMVGPTVGTVAAPTGGSISYTPAAVGADSFTYQICDFASACDTATVSVTVNPIIVPCTIDCPCVNDCCEAQCEPPPCEVDCCEGPCEPPPCEVDCCDGPCDPPTCEDCGQPVAARLPDPDPSIDLVVDVPGGDAGVGDEVVIEFVATNTGNQTLTGVSLVDLLDGLGVEVPSGFFALPGLGAVTTTIIDAGDGVDLAPGDSVTTTASYVIQLGDLPGPLEGLATVTGNWNGIDYSDSSPWRINLIQPAPVPDPEPEPGPDTDVAGAGEAVDPAPAAVAAPVELPATGLETGQWLALGLLLTSLGLGALLMTSDRARRGGVTAWRSPQAWGWMVHDGS